MKLIVCVVAIIGILAAVAIPSFSRYINQAKKAEAMENLRSIGDGAVAFYNTDHYYGPNGLTRMRGVYPHCPDTSGNPKPCGLKALCTNPEIGAKMAPSTIADAIKAAPWPDLGFELTTAFNYCYAYTNNDDITKFEASATASLHASKDSIFRMSADTNGRLLPIIEEK